MGKKKKRIKRLDVVLSAIFLADKYFKKIDELYK